jgi:hypothetical protein
VAASKEERAEQGNGRSRGKMEAIELVERRVEG